MKLGRAVGDLGAPVYKSDLGIGKRENYFWHAFCLLSITISNHFSNDFMIDMNSASAYCNNAGQMINY